MQLQETTFTLLEMSMLKPRWLHERRGSGTRPQIGQEQMLASHLSLIRIWRRPLPLGTADNCAHSYLAEAHGPRPFGDMGVGWLTLQGIDHLAPLAPFGVLGMVNRHRHRVRAGRFGAWHPYTTVTMRPGVLGMGLTYPTITAVHAFTSIGYRTSGV